MTKQRKRLPIGIENFEKLITNDFYYVDKTLFIRELLLDWSEVNLFTRPRRFGKSLNMDMLASFFSPERDQSVFEGLAISRESSLCAEWMGRYPVISLTLKGIQAPSFETAFQMAASVIREAALSHYRVLSASANLLPQDLESLELLTQLTMSENTLYNSLLTLSSLLRKHYGQKVVLLIDEYDVPLARADELGYYDQMVLLIRGVLGQVLKTNENLQFAVLTGCMRVARESIFTGLNNLRVLSVTDAAFSTAFGFTDQEVRELLAYYDLTAHYEKIRDWYDGYRWGNTPLYCPWDAVNYCRALLSDPDLPPQNYWINTSGNDAVRRFIRESGSAGVKREIEQLVSGGTVEKTIRQELTYRDMYASPDNIWSVLLMTGYLTPAGRTGANRFLLAIPNQEIRTIYEEQILEYFKESVQKDGRLHSRFCGALENGDAGAAQQCFGEYLRRTISIRDTASRRPMKENFYHGILLGILGTRDGWDVYSNRETGEGYSDILVEAGGSETALVLEIKYAEDGNLDAACQKALAQIEEKHYAEDLAGEGFDRVLKYGIACHKKRCRFMLAPEPS